MPKHKVVYNNNEFISIITGLFMSLLIIPIIVFRELDIIFPTIKYYTYSTGNVGLGFGGTGIIGFNIFKGDWVTVNRQTVNSLNFGTIYRHL